MTVVTVTGSSDSVLKSQDRSDDERKQVSPGVESVVQKTTSRAADAYGVNIRPNLFFFFESAIHLPPGKTVR